MDPAGLSAGSGAAGDAPQDLLQRILHAASTHPARPALSGWHGRPLRYRDLAVAVVATAKGLRRIGFVPGQRLLFALRPDPAAIVLVLATVAAGGTVVFVGQARGSALAARVALSEPAWAAADPGLYATGPGGLLRRFTSRGTDLPDLRALGIRTLSSGPWRPGLPAGTISLRALRRAGGVADDDPLPGLREDPAAEAVVIFTSGRVEPPRAVVHTRGSLGASMSMLATRFEIGHRARVYTDQLMIGLPALAVGAHWRLPPPAAAPRIDPARFLKSMGRATHTYLDPAALSAVLTAVAERLASPPPALQQVLVGGGPVPPALVVRTMTELPRVAVLAVFGRSEMVPIAIADGVDKLLADHDGDLVGDLVPGVVASVDPAGELIVAGPNLARGYLGEGPLAELATGHLAILRGRSVVLVGRVQHRIVRDRTVILPSDWEGAIEGLPGVRHAALVGIPDRNGSDRVVLALQPAGQPVNDQPLAGEPKQSNSRDDDVPQGQQVSILLQHPLAADVALSLPGLVDTAALPDEIVVVSAFPLRTPDGPVDRNALRRLLSEFPADEHSTAEPLRQSGRRGRSTGTGHGGRPARGDR